MLYVIRYRLYVICYMLDVIGHLELGVYSIWAD